MQILVELALSASTYNIFISRLSLPNNTSQLKKQQISKKNLLLQFAFRAILGQKERQTCPKTSLSLFGANGDTELFEKSSNINGFGTFGQHFFLF